MAALQRLSVARGDSRNENHNNNKGSKKTLRTRSTTLPRVIPYDSSTSEDESSSSTATLVAQDSMLSLTEALEDVKSSINDTVSSKIDSVFEKTKLYLDKSIKPLSTRIDKVEIKVTKTDDFAKKSVQEILDSHLNIWQTIKQIQDKQNSSSVQKPSKDLHKQNNLLITGIKLDNGETLYSNITKMFSDLDVQIGGAYHTKMIPGGRALVEFNSCWDKRAAYKARTQLKGKNYRNVFFNEDLTEDQADLFYLARSAKKQDLVKSAWTLNGSTFISKTIDGEQEMQEVSSRAHLQALLPKMRMPAIKNPPKKASKTWSSKEHEKTPTTTQARVQISQESQARTTASTSRESQNS